jgi:transposase
MLSAQYAANAALTIERDAFKKDNAALRLSKISDGEEIKRLSLLIAKLKRMVFGQKSEKLIIQIEQLELELEELHINQGLKLPAVEVAEFTQPREPKAPRRRPLPQHLPRDIHTHLPTQTACPDCGGDWQVLGEDVSEILEYIPASYRVVRHVRPRLTCACCDRMAQAAAPSRPVILPQVNGGLK